MQGTVSAIVVVCPLDKTLMLNICTTFINLKYVITLKAALSLTTQLWTSTRLWYYSDTQMVATWVRELTPSFPLTFDLTLV